MRHFIGLIGQNDVPKPVKVDLKPPPGLPAPKKVPLNESLYSSSDIEVTGLDWTLKAVELFIDIKATKNIDIDWEDIVMYILILKIQMKLKKVLKMVLQKV